MDHNSINLDKSGNIFMNLSISGIIRHIARTQTDTVAFLFGLSIRPIVQGLLSLMRP